MALFTPADDLVGIIEPDDKQRQALSQVVQRVFAGRNVIVREASSLKEWLSIQENIKNPNSTTVLIDANMPDEEGNLAAKKIWQANPRCKIVFWSYSHRSAYLAEIRRLAPGSANFAYLLKTDSTDALSFALTSVVFHNNTYISPTCRDSKPASVLTRIDYETLIDVAFGLTDKAISQRRAISVRGVQNRLTTLLQKLACDPTEQPMTGDGAEFFNSRTRLVYEAFTKGHISRHDIEFHRPYFERWVNGAAVPNKKIEKKLASLNKVDTTDLRAVEYQQASQSAH